MRAAPFEGPPPWLNKLMSGEKSWLRHAGGCCPVKRFSSRLKSSHFGSRAASGRLTRHGLLAVALLTPVALAVALLSRPTQSPAEKLPAPQVAVLAPTGDLEASLATSTFLLSDNFSTPGLEAEQTTAASAITVEVQSGDTLMALLLRQGIDNNEAHAAIVALETVYSPKQIRPGQAIRLTLTPTDDSMSAAGEEKTGAQLVSLQLQPSVDAEVEVSRGDDGGYLAQETAITFDVQIEGHRGIITNSLYEDATAAGVPVPLLIEMIRALSYDIDFQREIQPGDAFEVVYEAHYDQTGQLAKTGTILYIGMTLSGKELSLYHYIPESGNEDFFDGKGQSVRKALLRTPVDGARITSNFGMRKHPILGYNKMHKGVDFGAPTGTPIYAAGDGVIEYADWNKGYGKYVRIKHNGTYSTAYGHMSKIAKGINKGTHVQQGEIIGYVGATGQATGPHLHYEVLVEGSQVNPLDIKLPSGEKLEADELDAFQRVREEIDRLRQEVVISPPLVAGGG